MTHHYYICRGSVPTKVQILCHFLKSIRLKNHICQLVILPIMCPVGLHLSDRGAAAWCGFTICPVGLHLSDRGAAAWCGFTICPVGLHLSDRGAVAWCGFTICPVGLHLSDRGAAAWCRFTMRPVGQIKGRNPCIKGIAPRCKI